MGLEVIIYTWACSFCDSRENVHHDRGTMSVDQVKSHVSIVPKGWKRINGVVLCL